MRNNKSRIVEGLGIGMKFREYLELSSKDAQHKKVFGFRF